MQSTQQRQKPACVQKYVWVDIGGDNIKYFSKKQ